MRVRLVRALVDDILWRCPGARVDVGRRSDSGDYQIRVLLSDFEIRGKVIGETA